MALNIFANDPIYGGWTKKGENISLKDCTPQDMYEAMDEMAEVTDSDKGFGLSVCFYLHGGVNRVYKNLSTTSKLRVGDKVHKDDLYVVTLQKKGENDIYRITEEK